MGSNAVALGDIDGRGNFTASSQSLGDGPAQSVDLADLDGDGDLDVFIAEESGGGVWFNDGSGAVH